MYFLLGIITTLIVISRPEVLVSFVIGMGAGLILTVVILTVLSIIVWIIEMCNL